MSKKLFLVVNVDWFFLSHRLPVALEAKRKGYDVTVLAIEEEGKGDEIRAHGLEFIPLPSTRGGQNIFTEWSLLFFLYKQYKVNKPYIIHHVAVKPVLYGSIAAKWAKIDNIVNAVSGLGSILLQKRKTSPLFWIISSLYKYSLNNPAIKVIVQNEDDKIELLKLGVLKDHQLSLIKGSGVNLLKFPFTQKQQSGRPIHVVLASRMLRDKGIFEFVEAAELLKGKYNSDIIFTLAGKIDRHNISSIEKLQLLKWNREGSVNWIGHCNDMIELYQKADIVVLPSYREGLSKSLIEACAIGRPIVTTNVPGCKDVVINGVNGYLVPVKNSPLLAEAIEKLFLDEELRLSMGKNGRSKAEAEFSIDSVLEKTFEVYEN